jgi:predicted AAA+ superfamily ATPase
MLKREKYLKLIRPFYNKDLIKIITGIRRSGKSILLSQIIEELIESGISQNNIIFINLEDIEYYHIKNAVELNNYIKSLMTSDMTYYLFFDEIQNLNEWEILVNSLKSKFGEKISIFITGSNSNLLSGELATHLAGRYVSFKMAPFNFQEIIALKNITDKQLLADEFNDFMLWGGMPQRFTLETKQAVKTYLEDLYNSIIIKDIIFRNKIKDVEILHKIIEYFVTNPAQTLSITNITNYFKNDNRIISNETLYNYLEYIIESFIISRIPAYDIRGKRLLTRKDKYYLTDLGLGQIKNSTKKQQLGAYLENIVYNELVYRGYEVTVGNLKNAEIDFIATRFEEKIYIQVCHILYEQSVIDREFGAYKKIDDNYPKYVISMDTFNFSQNGIIHQNIIEWLLAD